MVFYMFLGQDVNGKLLPRENGSNSTYIYHHRFQQWVQLGIFKKIWIRLLKD
jgi:transposase